MRIFQSLRLEPRPNERAGFAMRGFPSHVVCAWLGNSEAVARKHYLQDRESDFQKAARIPARGTPASGDFETHRVTRNEETPRFRRVASVHVGDTGFEPVTSTV
jgi:hypothetical protein